MISGDHPHIKTSSPRPPEMQSRSFHDHLNAILQSTRNFDRPRRSGQARAVWVSSNETTKKKISFTKLLRLMIPSKESIRINHCCLKILKERFLSKKTVELCLGVERKQSYPFFPSSSPSFWTQVSDTSI